MSNKHSNEQKERIKRLIEDLKNDDPDIRYETAWALGMIGPQAASAIPALNQALNDEDYEVAQQAAWALAKIKQK